MDMVSARFLGIAHKVQTPDLIAELEKRRPCNRCKQWQGDSSPCIGCLWVTVRCFKYAKDNFKEAK
jgi:hypothetical protein